MGAEGDETLARPGRRVDDDVRSGEDLEERFLLGGVERDALLGGPGEEGFEGAVAPAGERGEIERGR